MAKGRRKKSTTKAESSQNSGASDFRSELWGMADALRGSMDAAEYKHVVLGLIFLKYISDAFEEAHAKLVEEVADGADPEDPDEYRAKNIFWVPPEARWPILQSQARQPTIGRTVDDAMTAIERDNPALKDVLPKNLRPPGIGQDPFGTGGRPGKQHQGRRRRRTRHGRSGQRLRVFPGAVRARGGQEGRRVLHPTQHRAAPGRDVETLRGEGLRPPLRLIGNVRAVNGVH